MHLCYAYCARIKVKTKLRASNNKERLVIMRALLSELALLLLLAAIAVIIRQSESRHKLPTTDDVQNFRKFSSNSTKLSYTWSDCSKRNIAIIHHDMSVCR